MSHPFSVDVNDPSRAQETARGVRVGHYFVFLDRVLDAPPSGRLGRLLARKPAPGGGRVLPLIDHPVELPGVTLTPHDRAIDPVACVVSERDLYRAEEDTVHLLVASPQPLPGLKLEVEQNGQPLTTRELDLSGGMVVESLAALLPGGYRAQLAIDGRRVGTPCSFTVAEYTLAPLSGRLLRHQLDRSADRLSFTLAVESYQVPFEGKLDVALVEGGRELTRQTIKPRTPGVYEGRVQLTGEGPFRLRLSATDDAERVAEVAIPGSRAREREVTVISELGQEVLLSLMPEPGALAVRGAHLTEGDFLATPLVVEQVVGDRWTIQARADVGCVVLAILDLCTGRFTEQRAGEIKAGGEIVVEGAGPMCTVFVGAIVDDQPFEGYTTFIRPSTLGLTLDAPEQARPGTDVVVKLGAQGAEEVPVLLCVRDQRLTSTDLPEVGLASAAKAAVDRATTGMSEQGLVELEPLIATTFGSGYLPNGVEYVLGGASFDDDTPRSVMRRPPSRPSLARGAARMDVESEPLCEEVACERAVDAFESVSACVVPMAMASPAAEAPTGHPYRETGRALEAEDLGPTRTTFPQVLFYDIVTVRGTAEVVIPAGDALGSFTVEAFALAAGDWASATRALVVDKPVRIDLELPPAVHPEDKVTGRLRVATPSGRARLTLTCDGEPVSLPKVEAGLLATPALCELRVRPGVYCARVEDPESGEVDATELTVGTPGRFRSTARQIGLLQRGERLTLAEAGALTLRVLPAIDEPFGALVKATAGYSHLCCEQTAAKIISAVFMYLTSTSDKDRRAAEEIILAGVAREQRMLRTGQGFLMYPDSSFVSEHYSHLAVRYLWTLRQLDELPGVSARLRQAARQGVVLADTAARAHRMERVPRKISSIEDAHAAATGGGDVAAARAFIEAAVDFSAVAGRGAPRARSRRPSHAVADRALLAYAGASLLALGDLAHGITLANEVTRAFNESGALYSTVDSVAAISLMIQLRRAGVADGKGSVRVNGEEMTVARAAALADQVESVEVLDGVAALEVTTIVEEDWDRFSGGFPLTVGFRDARDKKVRRFSPGDRADLLVQLSRGYQVGDLLHVSLPAALSWIQGGGKVKRFTVDFQGKNELRVPLVVTGKIDGKQHFAVCVRNMFEEERASNPGPLTVSGGGLW
jgi:hypothetical protein